MKRFLFVTLLFAVVATSAWAIRRDTLTERSSGEILPSLIVDGILETHRAFDPSFFFCGQNVNASTVYFSPVVATFNGSAVKPIPGDGVCDGFDGATEATQSLLVSAQMPALRCSAITCWVSSDPASNVVFTFRAADAATAGGTLTCTVPGTGSAQNCVGRAEAGKGAYVPAAAEIAIQAVTLEDLSLQDAACTVQCSAAE